MEYIKFNKSYEITGRTKLPRTRLLVYNVIKNHFIIQYIYNI